MKLLAHFVLISLLLITPVVGNQEKGVPSSRDVETTYDAARNETTIKFPRVQLGGDNGPYYSLHGAISFKYPGQTKRKPQFLTFELQTIVKAQKLRVDLHVKLFIDGHKVVLSSNRWAEMNVMPGKSWISEHIALRMPYDVLVRITKAKEFAIELDKVRFVVGDTELQRLREFGDFLTSA